jgi:hypothetical protein
LPALDLFARAATEFFRDKIMIDNRTSLCNSTDTIADFVAAAALMRELAIREIAPEKVVGILPVLTKIVDCLTWQPHIRVLYRTSRQ